MKAKKEAEGRGANPDVCTIRILRKAEILRQGSLGKLRESRTLLK